MFVLIYTSLLPTQNKDDVKGTPEAEVGKIDSQKVAEWFEKFNTLHA